MSRRPDSDALRVAADWLRCNDGDESTDCGAVAKWLDDQADANDLRTFAKMHGLSVPLIRRARAIVEASEKRA